MSNSLNLDQAQRYVLPDLGSNCLQGLSADRQKSLFKVKLFALIFSLLQKLSSWAVFLVLCITGTFTTSEDPDEMPHNVAFHLGLHYLLG